MQLLENSGRQRMSATILKILTKIAAALVTESLIKKWFCILGWQLVQSTKNKLDDQMFRPVCEALDEKPWEK